MEKTKQIRILNILIIIFTAEKTLQHLITAVLFLIKIPGLGTPDIGSRFAISNPTMGLLNLIYFIVFGFGLVGFMKKNPWGIPLIIAFAVLDIILEFLFHYFFFITVSVIMSTVLTILSLQYLKLKKHSQV